jgi:hypothetical protein
VALDVRLYSHEDGNNGRLSTDQAVGQTYGFLAPTNDLRGGLQIVGTAFATANTITIPPHLAGDIVIIFAWQDGSITPPAVGAGFFTLLSGGNNLNANRIGWRTAADSATTSGTWTDATRLICVVVRNATIDESAADQAGGGTDDFYWGSVAFSSSRHVLLFGQNNATYSGSAATGLPSTAYRTIASVPDQGSVVHLSASPVLGPVDVFASLTSTGGTPRYRTGVVPLVGTNGTADLKGVLAGESLFQIAVAVPVSGTDTLNANDVQSTSSVTPNPVLGGAATALDATDVQSTSSVTPNPVMVRKVNFDATDVQSTSSVTPNPVMVRKVNLDANDTQSTSSVAPNPVMVRKVNFDANDAQSLSSVAPNPVLVRKIAFDANDDQSLSSVAPNPVFGQKHVLNANDDQSLSSVAPNPVLGHRYNLNANDDQSLSSVAPNPTVGQSFVLNANDVQSTSSVTPNPVMARIINANANDVQSTSQTSVAGLVVRSNADANDIQALAQVSPSPNIGQKFVLNANDVQSTSQTSVPVMVRRIVFDANDTQSTSQVTAPVFAQKNVLNANDVQSTSQVTVPALVENGGILADDAQSLSQVTPNPVIQQKHTLLSFNLQSTSSVSVGILAQKHVLVSTSIQTTTQVTVPDLGDATMAEYTLTDDVGAILTDDVGAILTGSNTLFQSFDASDVQSITQIVGGNMYGAGYTLVDDVGATLTDDIGEPLLGSQADPAVVNLNANDVQSTSTTSATSFSIAAFVNLNATDIQSVSRVSAPRVGALYLDIAVTTSAGFPYSISTPSSGTLFWRLDTAEPLTAPQIAAGGGVKSGSVAVTAPSASGSFVFDDVPTGTWTLHAAFRQTSNSAYSNADTYELVLDNTREFVANNLQSTSSVGTPSLQRTGPFVFDATDTQSTSSVTSPVLIRQGAFDAVDAQSTSSVSVPNLFQKHVLNANDVQSTSQVSAPQALSGGRNLTHAPFSSASEVTIPVLIQKHVLTADDATSLTEVSGAKIDGLFGLVADDIEARPETSSPELKIALTANSVSSDSSVVSPVIAAQQLVAVDGFQLTASVKRTVVWTRIAPTGGGNYSRIL